MKKRNLLALMLMLLLTCSLVLTGCSSDSDDDKDDDKKVESRDDKDDEDDKEDDKDSKKSKIEGKWEGTWDASEMLAESAVTGDEDLDKYFEFKDLTIGINFEFDGDEMTVEIDKDSVDDFAEKCLNVMVDAVKLYLEDMAAEAGVTFDEFIEAAGYDSYEAFLEDMDIDALKEEMISEMDLEDQIESGEFELDGDEIILSYEDGTTDKMKYELDDDELTLILEDDELTMEIKCERK